MNRKLFAVVCWIVVVTFPVSSFAAQTSSAMLYLNGMVRVNGVSVHQSVAVFEGDAVETQKGAATIARKGSVVTLSADSKVVYGAETVQMAHGSAAVKGNRSTRVQVGNYTVTPKTDDTQFQVAKGPQGVLIASLSGAVHVSGEGRSYDIVAGHSMNIPGVAAAPAQAGTEAVVANSINAVLFTVGASIAAAVGTMIAVTNRKPVSPGN